MAICDGGESKEQEDTGQNPWYSSKSTKRSLAVAEMSFFGSNTDLNRNGNLPHSSLDEEFSRSVEGGWKLRRGSFGQLWTSSARLCVSRSSQEGGWSLVGGRPAAATTTWMPGWTAGWLAGWMDGWTTGRLAGRANVHLATNAKKEKNYQALVTVKQKTERSIEQQYVLRSITDTVAMTKRDSPSRRPG